MFLRTLRNFLLVVFPLTFIGILLVGIVRIQRQNTPAVFEQTAVPSQSTTTSKPTSTPVAGASPQPISSGAVSSTKTVTGNIYRTPWGPVQVKVTLNQNEIQDVATPEYPSSPPSQYAHAYLIRQAIESGSANIQGVSGATYTSAAFQQSLESALAQASQ